MDEMELPPTLTDEMPRDPSLPPPTRKRSRLAYEPATSSDPALFSSDDAAPSAEHYSAKRKKDKWRGTWWGDRLESERGREKRQFKRKYDSGIFMGSEGTDSGLEDELLRDQNIHMTSSAMPRPWEALQDRRGDVPDADADEEAWLDNVDRLGPTLVAHRTQDPGDPGNKISKILGGDIKLVVAKNIVRKCLEHGSEDVNMMGVLPEHTVPEDLGQILQPLKQLTKHTAMVERPARQEAFSSLEPELKIYLSNNKLWKLPSALFELTNLRYLSLRSNNLTEIPSSIGQLTNLRTLNVSLNQLQTLPFEVLHLIQHGRLQDLKAHPNPFLQHTSTFEREPINVEQKRPLQHGIIHRITHFSSSSPQHFTRHGTSIAANKVPHTRLSNARSLTETALSSCATHLDLSDLSSLALPSNIDRLLQATRDVHISGPKRCTMCAREIIIPRKTWIEWWQLKITHSDYDPRTFGDYESYPFLRQECSWDCGDSLQRHAASKGQGSQAEELQRRG